MIADLRTVTDDRSRITYMKGKLLGKGGFATCYEFSTGGNKTVFAAKCITKASTKTKNQGLRLKDEIEVHRQLNHEHIVKFYHYFEDRTNLYILLELCENKSLYEMHKRRRRITEPETRFFSRQIVQACEYIHKRKIIHRDLKLANVLLDKNVNTKLADFGLAGKVNEKGDKKTTMCGTPNYIAPEILTKAGHSYEVDVWSLGCMIYTLLVGKPPFDTERTETTYEKIKKNDYIMPHDFYLSTNTIITECLRGDVSLRPSMTKLLAFEFFGEFIPKNIPKSAITTEPKFNIPLPEVTVHDNKHDAINVALPSDGKKCIKRLQSLKKQISDVLNSHNTIKNDNGDVKQLENSEDPRLAPIYWISKWVDYTDRYGLGYQLNNDCTGVVFNDKIKILYLKNDEKIQYVDSNDNETILNSDVYSEAIEKKIALLQYFRSYMDANLMTTGAQMVNSKEESTIGRLPYLQGYHRTNVLISMYLSNGTLQINFLSDHIKIILCPVMKALTYIDQEKMFTTLSMDLLTKNGYTTDLEKRLKYAIDACNHIIDGLRK